jgi:hypothetical protein
MSHYRWTANKTLFLVFMVAVSAVSTTPGHMQRV